MNALSIVGEEMIKNCETIELNSGFTILKIRDKIHKGKILAIQGGSLGSVGRIVHLGQLVVSGSNDFVTPDARGIVTEILKPYEDCRTTDVIYVWFENELSAIPMKIENLANLPEGTL